VAIETGDDGDERQKRGDEQSGSKDAAAITHLTKDDAAALLDYNVPNEPVTAKTSMGAIVHHPTFGVVLKKKMDAPGIECVVQWPGHPKEGRITPFEFIRKHFGMAGRKGR